MGFKPQPSDQEACILPLSVILPVFSCRTHGTRRSEVFITWPIRGLIKSGGKRRYAVSWVLNLFPVFDSNLYYFVCYVYYCSRLPCASVCQRCLETLQPARQHQRCQPYTSPSHCRLPTLGDYHRPSLVVKSSRDLPYWIWNDKNKKWGVGYKLLKHFRGGWHNYEGLSIK